MRPLQTIEGTDFVLHLSAKSPMIVALGNKSITGSVKECVNPRSSSTCLFGHLCLDGDGKHALGFPLLSSYQFAGSVER